ncbi:O-antigen ligase family protein [Desulfosediminicola flagellatus]|uniref:O-antigen ligase family protein n=1 Tax=Desulfosediminicola flagellatus TaxID=2569541 RepID=UPI0010AD014F|nr:O-antigen ligase family protein [Desulfosediminicola flagellatus]
MKMPITLQVSLEKMIYYLIIFILTTIPLVFGSVHPVTAGFYGAIMLAVLGSWLLIATRPDKPISGLIWYLLPLIVLCYQILQTIPLPFSLIELLSPARAERIAMVNYLADTDIRAMALSENSRAGARGALFLLAVYVFYCSLTRVLQSDKRRLLTVCYCLIAVGVIQALYGLLQFIKPGTGILWLSIEVRAAYGSIIYKNQYASMLNMLWPLAIGCGLLQYSKTKRRRSTSRAGTERTGRRLIKKGSTGWQKKTVNRLMVQTAAVLMILAGIFSLSRGGILAMALVAVLLVVLLPFSARKKIIFSGLFLGVIVSYGTMLGIETAVSRFVSVGDAGATRTDLYMSSLPMLANHWLTGIGANSYAVLSPVYLKGFPADLLYDRVHNEYLELMIELGIPMALLFFAWLLGGMALLGARILTALKHTGKIKNTMLLASVAYAGIVGFLVHGLVDFGWRLPVNIVYCVTLLAITVTSLEGVNVTEKVMVDPEPDTTAEIAVVGNV